VEWENSEQESCSDHSIIRYAIGQGKGHRTEFEFHEVMYIMKKDNKEKFQGNLLRLAEKKLCKINKEGGTEDLDKALCSCVSEGTDIVELIEEFHDIMTVARSKSFRTQRASKKAISNKSVPWWTEEMTIMRKTVSALRRRYQRKRNSEDLTEQRKTQYLEGKAKVRSKD
jgi:hypothetical protein